MSANKKKKALIIASMASMIDNFNRKNIELLSAMGYDITLAANFKSEDSNSYEKNQKFLAEMKKKGYHVVHIDFTRKLTNISLQIKSIKQVRELFKRKFDIVHCHSPICSIITRILFQKYRSKYNSKLLYTAHGFHFYKGAPKKNWLIYYPAEKICSYMTDVLITINKEDYSLAKQKMKAKKVEYLPGIGIDLNKFNNTDKDDSLKLTLGCKPEDIMLLSVGELSERKNQTVVINALDKLRKDDVVTFNKIKYYIVGKGHLEDYYKQLIRDKDLENSIKLLGFRNDIDRLLNTADVFIFPSIQEGLPVALMEAMASGLPVIASRIRGNTDLIENGKGGFLVSPNDVMGFENCIKKLVENPNYFKNMKSINLKTIKDFSDEIIIKKTEKIYSELI